MLGLGYQTTSLASSYDFPGYISEIIVTPATPMITEANAALVGTQSVASKTRDRAIRTTVCYTNIRSHTTLRDSIITISIEVYLK